VSLKEDNNNFFSSLDCEISDKKYAFMLRESAGVGLEGNKAIMQSIDSISNGKYNIYSIMTDTSTTEEVRQFDGKYSYDLIVPNNIDSDTLDLNFVFYGDGGHSAAQATFKYNWLKTFDEIYKETGNDSFCVVDYEGHKEYDSNKNKVNANINAYFDYCANNNKNIGQAVFSGHSDGGLSSLDTACNYINIANNKNIDIEPVKIVYIDSTNVFGNSKTGVHNSITNAVLKENNAQITWVATSVKSSKLSSEKSFVENMDYLRKLDNLTKLTKDEGIFCSYIVPVSETNASIDHAGLLNLAILGDLNVIQYVNGDVDHIGNENNKIIYAENEFELHYLVYSSKDEEWKEVTAKELQEISRYSQFYTYKKYYNSDGTEITDLFVGEDYNIKIDIDKVYDIGYKLTSDFDKYEGTLSDSEINSRYNGLGDSIIPNNLGSIGSSLGGLIGNYLFSATKSVEGFVNLCTGYFVLDKQLAVDASELNEQLSSMHNNLKNGTYFIDYSSSASNNLGIDFSSILGFLDNNSFSYSSDLEYMISSGYNNTFSPMIESLSNFCYDLDNSINELMIEDNFSGPFIESSIDMLTSILNSSKNLLNTYNDVKDYITLESNKLLSYINESGYEYLSYSEIPAIMDDIAFFENSIENIETEMKRTKPIMKYINIEGSYYAYTAYELYYSSGELESMQAKIDEYKEKINICNKHIEYIKEYKAMEESVLNNIIEYSQTASNYMLGIINNINIYSSTGEITSN